MIKVALVDDQPLLVQGLSMIIGLQEDMVIHWTASNGREAVFKSVSSKPDVILMDLRMPEMNGVRATEAILSQDSSIKVLILTTFMEDDEIFESMKMGASGYLLKDATPETIVDAIRKVVSGGTVIEPLVASKLIKHLKRETEVHLDVLLTLTTRELEIARGIAQGMSNREIANDLFVSEGTVKNHLTNILEKLSLRDRTQLAIFVLKNDL
mgnify:CR=1 FL=1